MNIEIKAQVGARFKFEARNAKTDELTKETDWFCNMVLDQGLDLMATTDWFYGVQVGTGTSEPSFTQTQLDARFAQSTTKFGATTYGASDSAPYYIYVRSTYRFAAGVFNNTILGEVAIVCDSKISSENNKIINRARIKDAAGIATTLPMANDEYLDVTCEVRCYIDSSDVISSIPLLNKSGVVTQQLKLTTRPALITTAKNQLGQVFNKIGSSGSLVFGSPNPLSAINLNPTGNVWTPGSAPAGITVKEYVAGSHQLDFTKIVDINVGNDTALKTLFIKTSLIDTQTQIEPPLIKNNTQKFIFEYSLTWSRYVS